jgi:hypothetical protein
MLALPRWTELTKTDDLWARRVAEIEVSFFASGAYRPEAWALAEDWREVAW